MRTFVAILTLCAGAGTQKPVEVAVTLDPLGVARRHAPVVVEIPVERRVQGWGLVRIGNEDRPVQLDSSRGALRAAWIEPTLDANETVRRTLRIVPDRVTGLASFSYAFHDTDKGDHLASLLWPGVDSNARPALAHFVTPYSEAAHARTYKHFHHIAGLHGEGWLTKGPGGKYTHHRGVFLGWNKSRRGQRGWDFWHCKGVSLRDLSDRRQTATGPVFGREHSVAEWTTGEGEVIVREHRTATIWAQPGDRRLIDFDVRLEAVGGTVALRGDPHHAGFQIRLSSQVNKRAKQTRYVRPAAAQAAKNDTWDRLSWAACLFSLEHDGAEHAYTVQHMDHPSNPRPIRYSTRPYGRFGSFFEADLEPGKPLELRYRIAVFDRDALPASSSHEWLTQSYLDFAQPVRVRVGGK